MQIDREIFNVMQSDCTGFRLVMDNENDKLSKIKL